MIFDDIDPLARKILTEARLNRFLQVAAQRLNCLTVVFENIGDPLNVSACLRSTEAFGVGQAWYVSEQALPFNRTISGKTRRWLELHHRESFTELVDELRTQGYSLLGTLAGQDTEPVEALPLPPKVALVMGNEHTGLSDCAREACDHLVTIPMYGFAESLNLSTATAILLRHFSEAYRARGGDIYLPEAEQRRLIEGWVARDVARKTRRNPPPDQAGDAAPSRASK